MLQCLYVILLISYAYYFVVKNTLIRTESNQHTSDVIFVHILVSTFSGLYVPGGGFRVVSLGGKFLPSME